MALLVGGVLAGSCSGEHSGELDIYAASSLSDAFRELGTAFTTSHGGTSIAYNFASSSVLATQISEGAPADVFASADRAQMDRVLAAGYASVSVIFATNELVAVVSANNSPVHTFADLARAGVRVVIAAEDVPAGRYAREVFQKASGPGGIAPGFGAAVLRNVRSQELNVRAVRARVELGEADAGIVYLSDVLESDVKLARVPIPAAFNVTAEYYIAATGRQGPSPRALEFIDFVRSERGSAILARYGFTPRSR